MGTPSSSGRKRLRDESDQLADLRRETGVSLLYITHDLLSARVVTEELLVLKRGRVVERGPTKQVLQRPSDEYTKRLLAALPNPFTETARPLTPAEAARPVHAV